MKYLIKRTVTTPTTTEVYYYGNGMTFKNPSVPYAKTYAYSTLEALNMIRNMSRVHCNGDDSFRNRFELFYLGK